MSEREGTPETQGQYSTWEEFDMHASALLKSQRDKIPKRKNSHKTDLQKSRLLHVSHRELNNSAQDIYTYRVKEESYGFYLHVKNSATPRRQVGQAAITPRSVDIAEIIGMSFSKVDVKDCTMKFVRGNLYLRDQPSAMYVLVNTEYDLRNRAYAEGRKMTAADRDDAIEHESAAGPFPVWHATADFGTNFVRHLELALNAPLEIST